MLASIIMVAALQQQARITVSPQVTVVTKTAETAAEHHAKHLAHLAHLARVKAAAAGPVTLVSKVVAAAPGSFQACVIARESGGNPAIVNPLSGAGGLYQFLPSTWAALGFSGLPENASVAVQNQAFQVAFAQDGTSPWAPYDGC